MEIHRTLGDKVCLYRRREGGAWHCSTYLKGKEWRRSTKEKSLARARDIAEDWYLELTAKARVGSLRSGKTFAQAAKTFEREYEAITRGRRSPKWVQGHKDRLRLHLLPWFGKKLLSEISSSAAQEYRVHRMTEPKRPEAVDDPGGKAPKRKGRSTAFRSDGSGRPLVFVHGNLADHDIWDGPAALVARHCRVVRPTLRYHGASPWPDDGEGFGADAHAEELSDFIVGCGLAPADLVGWSYGAVVCLCLAARRPELVRSLFLYEPVVAAAIVDPEERRAVANDRDAMFAEAAAHHREGRIASAVEAFIDGVNGAAGGYAAFPEKVRQVFERNARTLGPFFAGPPPASLSVDDFRTIQSPTALLVGEKTRDVWRVAVPILAGLIPQSELRIIPGAGHLWPVQDPENFAKHVLERYPEQ